MCLIVGVHNFYPTLCIILQGMKVKLKVRAEGTESVVDAISINKTLKNIDCLSCLFHKGDIVQVTYTGKG